jgi:hypothetical protein
MGTSDSAETESILSGDFASVSETNTTLEIQRFGKQWWTKDEQVSYHRKKEGWIVITGSEPIWKAFREYGITSSIEGAPTYFPSLQMARQAVSDVSLEAGLNIDSRLMRGKFISYKIGDLPVRITREEGHWLVRRDSAALSQSLKKHFNSVKEFKAAWESTDIALAYYPSRNAAYQAVTNWLAQIIAEK